MLIKYIAFFFASHRSNARKKYHSCTQNLNLTSLGKELRIDALESFLLDDSRRTFGLETAIYPLQLVLREFCRSTKARQRVWPVSRCLLLLVFRVCESTKGTMFVLITREKKSAQILFRVYRGPVSPTDSLTRLKNFAESSRRNATRFTKISIRDKFTSGTFINAKSVKRTKCPLPMNPVLFRKMCIYTNSNLFLTH